MGFDELMLLDEEYLKEIERIKGQEKDLILFGAGCTSDFIVQTFRSYQIEPAAFSDNDARKVGKIISGIEVVPVFEVRHKYKDALFYITTQLFYIPIKKQLLSIGIKEDNIIRYDLICQFQWERDYKKYFVGNSERFREVYENFFCDFFSREVFAARIAFLITRNREYVLSVRSDKQYFEPELIDYGKIRNYIDIGTYTGDSIVNFVGNEGRTDCRVWGFEPDDILYQQAVHNTEKMENVEIIKKAVSDKEGTAKVCGSMGPMQSISKNIFGIAGDKEEETSVEFEVCMLDKYFEGKNVENAFIKMDIEGAEMEALRGGVKMISENSPILAICIYHKADDIISILKYIYGMNENYKFFVRHYSDNQTETVLYAVPQWGEAGDGGQVNE